MKKRKTVNILFLKRVMSFTLILTLLLGLVTAADIFYPTQDNLAKAASFEVSGSGVGAPPFNSANFPALDTTVSTQYYYGKEGNAFYGVTNGTNYWELVDTDARMNGDKLESTWGIGRDGQTILNYTNSLVSSHFNAADKNAMRVSDVSVDTYKGGDGYSGTGTGSVSGAYLWPLSARQLTANGAVPSYSNKTTNSLATMLQTNANWNVWTRSFVGVSSGGSNAYAWCTYINSMMSGNAVDSNTNRVAPAFNLDLSKVLAARNAASATSQVPLSAVGAVSGNIKFLINAGTNKSSFNVSAINGKNLTNIFAGNTYSFNYTGASTGQLNGGTNYISAMIYDSAGKAVYYGNLGTVSAASGTANITIPSGLAGTYTLALFEEEKCAANKTDYASSPVYAKFTVLTRNYETDAEISGTQASSVSVGDTISNKNFSAKVSYKNGTTSTGSVYLIPSADFEKLSDKRSVSTTSVTVPNGSPTFKVTAVFVPTYTDGRDYWSKEFTFHVNYEGSTAFSTTHGSGFSLNDTIYSNEFSGTISWLNGSKTQVSADDLYIVPASVWGDGLGKEQVEALTKYDGGKSIRIDSSELNGAQTYSIVTVYFPSVAGADSFHTQVFEFASSTFYPTAFKASYIGSFAEFGSLLTDADFSGKYVLSDADKTEVEAAVKYVLPTAAWDALSEGTKGNEQQLKKVKGVNSIVIPSEASLKDTESYGVTVVYYDYSEQHSYGGGTDAGECSYYAHNIQVPLLSTPQKDYKSYTALGITWYYQVDGDGNAANVYTVNEDINQSIDKNGVFNIPEKIDGRPVRSIGTGTKARPFIPANVYSYTSIHFPDTLTDINDYAFYANTSFARLEIPASVNRVGNFAFYDCDNISNVKIMTSAIGTAAFGNCDGLIEVSVDGTSAIGKVAFAECINLTKLTISGNTSIGKSAFADDSKINAVNLKRLSGSKIEPYAFKGCTGIKEVFVPSTNKVEAYAFEGCTGITNLELDIETVENDSFNGCCNIQNLIFGRNVSDVEYNWGGYSSETYSSGTDYTDVINTTVYVKNKDTRFETYRDGDEYYSSFMGHYIPSGPYKYSRDVTVYMPKEAATGHSTDGTLVSAVANYYQTAQDDVAEGGNTFKTYYSANGLLNVGFSADENVDDQTINLPSVRDGITAYYDGKVYDNARMDKKKVIVKPVYSDAAPAKEVLTDFNFFTEAEADEAIREWIKSTDYSYKNVIPGKLEEKDYTYSQYLGYVESNQITGDDLETERLAMIQSVFNDKGLFLAATEGVVDNPEIHEVNSSQNYAIQHMSVIYYPNSDTDKDADYNSNEPTYYLTEIDVKVVKYTDEMYFFDQGFTYETVVKEIKGLQDKITELEADIERLEASNNELAEEKNAYSNALADCRQQLDQYVSMYNKLVEELNKYVGSTDVDGDGYFGTKTEQDADGNEVIKHVVWVNGVECGYEKTGDTITAGGAVYDVYIGTGDIDGDGVADTFKFYVSQDGVHVIEMNGETTDKVYSDPIRALERKLTAQLTAIRNQLSSVSRKISELKEALGIGDENFDGLSSEEQLGIILDKVKELLSEMGVLEDKISENEEALGRYDDAVRQIYQQLVSGTLDGDDVSTLQKKLSKILSEIQGLQTENATLSENVSSLEQSVDSLNKVVSDKELEIEDKNFSIKKLKENVQSLQAQTEQQAQKIEELTNSTGNYVLTVDDAARLFGTSKNASAAQVKEAINAFVAAKVESENTIRAIQKKLNTNATGDALAALVGAGSGNSQPSSGVSKQELDALKAANSVLTNENNSLKNENRSLQNNVTSLTAALSEALKGTGDGKLTETVESLNNELKNAKTLNDSLSRENGELKESNAALLSENGDLIKKNTVLTGENEESEKLAAALENKNKKLSESNKELKSKNTALAKKVSALSKKNEELAAKNNGLKSENKTLKSNSSPSAPNPGGNSSAQTRVVYVTPSPTAPGSGNVSGKERSDSAFPTVTPRVSSSPAANSMEKGKQARAKATPAPNNIGISSSLVPAGSSQGTSSQPGTVITMELPDNSSTGNTDGATVAALDQGSSYLGVMASNGERDKETTDEEKIHANEIFAYYASHLEELANLGAEDIRKCIGDSTKVVGITGIASIDVLPSAIQKEAMKNNENLKLSLTSEKFKNGNMYLVVHESTERDGKFDVVLKTAQNDSVDLELEDLSPVSVAEVTVVESAAFAGDEAEVPKEAIQQNEESSNKTLKVIFIVIAILALCGAGGLVWAVKTGRIGRR
ncbi:hypothetical protein D7V86_15135 [bacterium D16-51]|nr:hypothetical protein D7V96_20550 [bacterium D16-59]RKI58759.1 hypothetical protein D7V86_15135 [bacterium D16-51]